MIHNISDHGSKSMNTWFKQPRRQRIKLTGCIKRSFNQTHNFFFRQRSELFWFDWRTRAINTQWSLDANAIKIVHDQINLPDEKLSKIIRQTDRMYFPSRVSESMHAFVLTHFVSARGVSWDSTWIYWGVYCLIYSSSVSLLGGALVHIFGWLQRYALDPKISTKPEDFGDGRRFRAV